MLTVPGHPPGIALLFGVFVEDHHHRTGAALDLLHFPDVDVLALGPVAQRLAHLDPVQHGGREFLHPGPLFRKDLQGLLPQIASEVFDDHVLGRVGADGAALKLARPFARVLFLGAVFDRDADQSLAQARQTSPEAHGLHPVQPDLAGPDPDRRDPVAGLGPRVEASQIPDFVGVIVVGHSAGCDDAGVQPRQQVAAQAAVVPCILDQGPALPGLEGLAGVLGMIRGGPFEEGRQHPLAIQEGPPGQFAHELAHLGAPIRHGTELEDSGPGGLWGAREGRGQVELLARYAPPRVLQGLQVASHGPAHLGRHVLFLQDARGHAQQGLQRADRVLARQAFQAAGRRSGGLFVHRGGRPGAVRSRSPSGKLVDGVDQGHLGADFARRVQVGFGQLNGPHRAMSVDLAGALGQGLQDSSSVGDPADQQQVCFAREGLGAGRHVDLATFVQGTPGRLGEGLEGLPVGLQAARVEQVGVWQQVPVLGIAGDVQVHEVDRQVQLASRPHRLHQGVGRFHGDVHGLTVLVLVDQHGEVGQSVHGTLECLGQGGRQLHGHGLGAEVQDGLTSRHSELHPVVADRHDSQGRLSQGERPVFPRGGVRSHRPGPLRQGPCEWPGAWRRGPPCLESWRCAMRSGRR